MSGVGSQVSGVNLVPFTLQKQNLAMALLSSLLAPAEVWQLQCIEVNQTSPPLEEGAAGDISTADLTYVLQQRTAAPYVGEVSVNQVIYPSVINRC